MNHKLKFTKAVGLVASAVITAGMSPANAAQVYGTDVIVQGSECVGVDCSSSENFGFDTVRLKENNLRIKFQDTSTGSFPSGDWQIIANDSSNGGASYLAIEDTDAGTTPFKVAASAGNNAMYIEPGGNVGLGTSNPAVDLHIATGNTPTLRLEQNTSSGFSAQTWDVAGNETNFFVRDVTNGSKLPFKIIPGAPHNSLYISASGDVGIGTTSPGSTLDVNGSIDTSSMQISGYTSTPNTSSTYAPWEVKTYEGTSAIAPKLLLVASDNSNNGISIGEEGSFFAGDSSDNHYIYYRDKGSSNWDFLVKGSVSGTVFNTTSSKAMKTGFETVSAEEVLDKLSSLAISKWSYKDDGATAQHIGPMAEDFYQAFGLGQDDAHIATVDADGIVMAAVQALNKKLEDKDAQIASLQAKIAELDNLVRGSKLR